LFSPLADAEGSIPFKFFNVTKEYDSLLSEVVAYLKTKQVQTISTLTSEPPYGDFGDAWVKCIEDIKQVDLSLGLQSALLDSDSYTVENLNKSSGLLSRAMKKVFERQMQKAFDNDKVSETHKKFSKMLETCLNDPAKMRVPDVDKEDVECAFPPIVQSGGKFSLTIGAESDENTLSSDVLICQIGVRFKEYTGVVGRTFLVNAAKEEKNIYASLVQVHEYLLKLLKPGAELGEIYDSVKEMLIKKHPELESSFGKIIGWGTGLDMRYHKYLIKAGNKQLVRKGMPFIVMLQLDGIPLSEAGKKKFKSIKGENFSLLISNTVLVEESGAVALTKEHSYDLDDIVFDLDNSSSSEGDADDGEESIQGVNSGDYAPVRRTRASHKTKEQLEAEKQSQSEEAQIAQRQQDLMKKKAQRAIVQGGSIEESEDEDADVPEINIYTSTNDYPKDLVPNQIYCDTRHEAVFLPIAGVHVPFHVASIKTVVKQDEDISTLLRFQFFHPTVTGTFAKDVPNTMRKLMTDNPSLNFIKEMCFRSRDPKNLSSRYKEIKDMQKKARSREKQKEQNAELVDQVDLVLLRNRSPVRLQVDATMKPPLRSGKCVGRLEAHANGLRFKTSKGETQDIIYANIKHFFFQDCKNELTVLVHFNLKNPLLVGKKLTHDIQFYTEVVEASAALDNSRRNMQDKDEMAEEHRERKFRSAHNKYFRDFSNEVLRVAEENGHRIGPKNKFETLVRAASFQGVPFKEMVTLTPTEHCLVNLTEFPFFIASINDVEHIHFERVTNFTKNFDMVIITKAQAKPGSTQEPQRITSIDLQYLDVIKKWINHEKITFTIGVSALNWKAVMVGVHDEMKAGVFWEDQVEVEDDDGNVVTEKKDVGWNFLAIDPAEDDDEDEEEEESVFSEDDASEESDESDEESLESEDEESSAPSDDEESAEDWDELERKAEASDKKRMRRDEEVERRPQKKNRR